MKNITKLFCSFILILLFISNKNLVNADESFTKVKSFETEAGDTLEIDISASYKTRIVKNEIIALDLNLKDMNIGFVSFYESLNYYYLYGSIQEGTNYHIQYPYIVRIEKNLSDAYYYFTEDTTGACFVKDIIEYGVDEIIASILVDGEYKLGGYYEGNWKIYSFTRNLEEEKSISTGTYDSTLSIAYDVIDVREISGKHYYFDRDFNILESYSVDEDKNGYFSLLSGCEVNGKYYGIGSTFNRPGKYVLSDGIHDSKVINLYATISGIVDGETYSNYVEYQVSGGDVYLNGEYSCLNGTVSKPGLYSLSVTGDDGYEKTVNFTISSELITKIDDGGSLSIGDRIYFNGNAKLNGQEINSGYELSKSGIYTLNLYVGDKMNDSITFTVPVETVAKTTKNWIYFLEAGIIFVILSITVFLIVRTKLKNKKIIEEAQKLE